jgi:hypothetical protein
VDRTVGGENDPAEANGTLSVATGQP